MRFSPIFAAATLAVALGCARGNAIAGHEPDFWSYWGDGKGEVNGYQLTFPRYGQERSGRAVAVFVTEMFSRAGFVKADPGQVPKEDERHVLKLNLTKQFQTGIYDYSIMTSVFADIDTPAPRPPLSPVKIAFSSQEWCGQVYDERLFRSDSFDETVHSYFLGESVRDRHVEWPADGITEDELPILVRELRGPILAPGAEKTVRLYPSSERTRLTHQPAAWVAATIHRSEKTETVEVPAGRFPCFRWTVAIQGGPTLNFLIEENYPRHLIKWEHSTGETAVLTGTERLAYWKLNHEGEESHLRNLGLAPRN